MKNKKYYLSALALVVVLLAGTAAISSKALPESIFYPVKTNVLEKLFGLTERGEFKQANYALALGEKRLQELETLKAADMLKTKAGERARDNFNNQTIATQSIILSLTQKEGFNSKEVLGLSEALNYQIERAKVIFNIDQLEVLPEGAPIPKATSTPVKILKHKK